MLKEFIGVRYETEEKKQKTLNTYDEYQLRKLRFINDYYTNENTQHQYFSGYNNNFHYAEVEKGKDLMNFKANEIEIIIGSCIYNIESTKSALLSFVRCYCTWAKSVLKEIDVNPVDMISAKDIVQNSKVLLSRKLIPLDKFFERCIDMEKKTIKIDNILPLVLARYGIIGNNLQQMRFLQWRDIDREKMVVTISDEDNGLVAELPIDDRFLFWIDKMEHADIEEYIIKGINGAGKPLAYPSVYARMNTCFKLAGINRIGFKDLLFNRQVELLLQMRKNKQLTKNDIFEMVCQFSFKSDRNYTPTVNLIKRYEMLTGDHVIISTKTGNKIANPEDCSIEEPLIVANRIIEELKMYISPEERRRAESKIKCDADGVIIED